MQFHPFIAVQPGHGLVIGAVDKLQDQRIGLHDHHSLCAVVQGGQHIHPPTRLDDQHSGAVHQLIGQRRGQVVHEIRLLG